MLISHQYEFIYIKNIKVAGSSVENYFQPLCMNNIENYDFKEDRTDFHKSNVGVVSARKNSKEKMDNVYKNHMSLEKIIEIAKCKHYYKFCVVRNPFDQLISYYFFVKRKYKNQKDIKEFILSKKYDSNYNRISLDNKPSCDYYIKFEKLAKGISKVCDDLKIDESLLNPLQYFKKSKNINSLAHYSVFYDDEMIEHVNKYFSKSLDFFGYKFSKE